MREERRSHHLCRDAELEDGGEGVAAGGAEFTFAVRDFCPMLLVLLFCRDLLSLPMHRLTAEPRPDAPSHAASRPAPSVTPGSSRPSYQTVM